MARRTRPRRARRNHFTPSELRTVEFALAILLALVALALKVDSPIVWTFLGVAIGHTLPMLGRPAS